MTYVEGDLVTGFTLELDGEPDAIERIWETIRHQMEVEIGRAHREQSAIWGGHPIMAYTIRPLMPFHGELRLRTTPAAEPPEFFEVTDPRD